LSIHPSLADAPLLSGISSALGASKGLNVSASSLELADSYTVALWSYCADKNGSSSSSTSCSTPTKDFWFDPVQTWHLNNTALADAFPKVLKNVLETYHSASKVMVRLYLVAISATAASTLIGFCAVFSLVGSILPLIITSVSTIGLLAASITATVVYSSVVGTFDTVLRSYGLDATLGLNMFALTWSAFLSALVSSFLWLFRGLCCCCGKRK
jgi:SUR7/PalI family